MKTLMFCTNRWLLLVRKHTLPQLLKVEIGLSLPIMIDYTSLHRLLIFIYIIKQGYGTLPWDTNGDIKVRAPDTVLE